MTLENQHNPPPRFLFIYYTETLMSYKLCTSYETWIHRVIRGGTGCFMGLSQSLARGEKQVQNISHVASLDRIEGSGETMITHNVTKVAHQHGHMAVKTRNHSLYMVLCI
ncbi:hypothetical protein EGW08_003223 [Elysia chlorotica]|uniref:Uncharacterized protein n=1 Tax=Elysia chlorotica TaxID=188477 RepID=A0A3S0ZX95_ELYCH|nr:hypothetical protein EGW08_003223 [Elysia chlorotica]